MVLCFGELLLRLTPANDGQWLTSNSLEVFVGGAEMNVATALANWRVPVCYCTVLPQNFLTCDLIKSIKAKHIDTSTILLKGDKLGMYFLQDGAGVQHADIIYDRKNSSFAQLKKGMIDWDKALNGIRWFHFSAISPALNKRLAEVCEEALQACARKNIFVSVDLNYRPKLWKHGRKPTDVMPNLMQYCDAVMGNVWSSESMLGIPVNTNLVHFDTKDSYIVQARQTSEKITQLFPKCKVVANTFRFDREDTHYFAAIFANNLLYVSSEYKTRSVVDKVGSGDCFMAAMIYGIYNHWPYQQVVNFATAAAFTKLFIKGDSTDKTVEEIRSFRPHE